MKFISKTIICFVIMSFLGIVCNPIRQTGKVSPYISEITLIQRCYASDKNELVTYVECRFCGHKEKLNKEFIAKIIGGVITGSGFWAWVTFLFEGTGFALPICLAIMIGGSAIMAYSNEITVWLCKKYECPNCQKKDWRIIEKEKPWWE